MISDSRVEASQILQRAQADPQARSGQASKRASEQARNQAERGSTSAECDPNHSKREAE
jgi:F0F1-type ATP synthase membrane subunit b/b'